MNYVNKIKILSPEQAIKIAAGEVVERPVNIIKEVVENSIDAGASKISIFIYQAGRACIKIIDNGNGMSPDDAKLSVAAHATSKITSVEDLNTLATFGFRGEALASINSVSNLTITTKTDEAHTGTRIVWNFGKLHEESLQSHPTGTTLEIANLFANIPARQKFLKKDETEWRAIVTLFQAFCLDYCAIHFQLYHEDKLQFNCPAVTKVTDRTAQLFDANLQEKTLALVNLENKLCSVTGVISTPHYYRYDRNQIFIFVNNRWVKNIDLTKAIMRGYAGTLPSQKFPAAIIFITIDADQVDVNIHPKKEEIKFLHPKKVETVIINSIKATLEESLTRQLQTSNRATFTLDYTSQHQSTVSPHTAFSDNSRLNNITPSNNFHDPKQNSVEHEEETYDRERIQQFPESLLHKIASDNKQIQNAVIEDYKALELPEFVQPVFQNSSMHNTEAHKSDKQAQMQSDQGHDLSIIGQYKQTYILCEKNGNLIFVDQHAAHERILYEQFKANFQNIATVHLIFPEFIKLQAQDITTIAPYLTQLKDHGIEAEIFSDTQLLIQATPVHLKNQLLQETIQQIIGWIHDMDATDQDRITHVLHEKIHTKMACSAAIKAGDTLQTDQMQHLLRDLMKIEHRFSCPHGRPTFWVLPIDYLEKQFKRDYGKKAEQFYDFL